MELNKDQLLMITHNYLEMSVEEDYWRFCRFTKKQLEQYQKDGIDRNTDYVSHCLGNANLTLDFKTDSDLLGLRFKLLERTSRKKADFDLYVDGHFYDHKSLTCDYSLLSFKLPTGVHDVCLYFPWSCEVYLQKVILSDGSFVEGKRKKLKILAFGDSITQGYHCAHPSLTYMAIVERQLEAEVINQGCGGYYFEKATLTSELGNLDPDLLIVAYGTNDFSQLSSPTEYRLRCRSYLSRLKELYPKEDILVILPIPRVDDKSKMRDLLYPYTLKQAGEILEEEALALNMHILSADYYPPLADFYVSDGLHPNDLGFTFYGQAVCEKIRTIKNNK